MPTFSLLRSLPFPSPPARSPLPFPRARSRSLPIPFRPRSLPFPSPTLPIKPIPGRRGDQGLTLLFGVSELEKFFVYVPPSIRPLKNFLVLPLPGQ